MSRDSIKMLAMLTMLLNHIANALLPAGAPLTNLFLCIGYFTAVTMCYFLVAGDGSAHSPRRCAGLLICASLFCDWALLAPVFTLLFSWAGASRPRKKLAFVIAALLYGGMAWLGSGLLADALGCGLPILVSGFFILYLYNGQRAGHGRTFYKWFFYAFYPAHLLMLGLLRLAVL